MTLPLNKVYLMDCLDGMKQIEDKSVDLVLTDPPYPNNAGHFIDGIESANALLKSIVCNHLIVFWDEMTVPPVPLPLVARHVWHRSNTNRPDNYEAIYEFNKDGIKRPSRVFRAPVICEGLTGCYEATGHPTQKPTKLMEAILKISTNPGMTVLDPFLGSGTTCVACKKLGRNFIGIEKEPAYVEIAKKRLEKVNNHKIEEWF